MLRGMAREKTTITVDRAKLDAVREITSSASASQAIDRALTALLASERLRRDVEAYTGAPPSADEVALGATVADWSDLADDTDWGGLYGDDACA